MTVHLISVGKSILASFDDPQISKVDSDLSHLLAKAELRAFPVARTCNTEAVHDGLFRCFTTREPEILAKLAAVCTDVEPKRWPRRISAELSSLPADGADENGIVLIASDTADGLRSALWNAVALARCDLGRITYSPDSAQLAEDIAGRILILRVPGMNVGNEKGFRKAMRELGALGRYLTKEAGLDDETAFDFHLSGGFKATIPYLIGLAEGIRSLPGDHIVKASVLHEDNMTSSINLPLHRIRWETMRSELENGWDAQGWRKIMPGQGLLEGYAYEAEDQGYRLTAFGEGLRVLFDYSAEGLSPG